MMSLSKHPSRIPLAASTLVLALALPAAAQVVPPPQERPPSTPEFAPPPPPPQQPRATPSNARSTPRPAPAPDIPFEPITERDADGNILPLPAPMEYVAIAHNPLVDLTGLSKMGRAIQERRKRMETQVVANLDLMAEVDGGFIETIRTADEASFRPATMKLVPLLMAAGQARTLTDDLVGSGAMLPSVGALTQKIMAEHNAAVTADANERGGEGDLTTDDRVLHTTLRTSLSEMSYYYDRLVMETADAMGAIAPDLGLSSDVASAIAPVLASLESESDLDRRAALARELFAKLPPVARAEAVKAAIESRPEIDASALLTIPADAAARDLDNEMRMAIFMSLVDGVPVDTSDLID